jgi:4-hydroxy-3-methylbut-2-enyl diphosphate reductase
LIEDESELRLEWLAGVSTVGLTAGASAPSVLVDQVVSALAGLGELSMAEHSVRRENVKFPLPVEVR